MSQKRDYYEALGVERDVSAADLKKTYRKLAMKFHPIGTHLQRRRPVLKRSQRPIRYSQMMKKERSMTVTVKQDLKVKVQVVALALQTWMISWRCSTLCLAVQAVALAVLDDHAETRVKNMH